jgi:hypothetical protein
MEIRPGEIVYVCRKCYALWGYDVFMTAPAARAIA